MQDLQLIEKKEISDIEIKDNEAETIEVEELPKTNEDIINELKKENKRLDEASDHLLKVVHKYQDELEWLKRYMKESGIDYDSIDLESWKEEARRRDRADYEKYGAMRPWQRRDFDDNLERIREAMRRRREQK